MYCYPHPLRRRGIVPGAARLTALLLECISLASLAFRRRGGETSASYATSYLIVSVPPPPPVPGSRAEHPRKLGYLVLLDAAELASLCGQASGRGCLPALPALAAGDALGLLVLACSRDWYGLWYWRGPWYSLSGEIGMGLFVALP